MRASTNQAAQVINWIWGTQHERSSKTTNPGEEGEKKKKTEIFQLIRSIKSIRSNHPPLQTQNLLSFLRKGEKREIACVLSSV